MMLMAEVDGQSILCGQLLARATEDVMLFKSFSSLIVIVQHHAEITGSVLLVMHYRLHLIPSSGHEARRLKIFDCKSRADAMRAGGVVGVRIAASVDTGKGRRGVNATQPVLQPIPAILIVR